VKRLGIILFCMLLLVSCDSGTHYAPVTDINPIESIPATGNYRVNPGETLYEIAWRYGLDYRYVAMRNAISPPYAIRPGQVLYLDSRSLTTNKITKTRFVSTPITTASNLQEPNYSTAKWIWPARGTVVKYFSAANRGINIANDLGTPIYATASGKVVYCGDGLRGYGKLIIIKHNNLYLSAYAHNRKILVKEGDWVKKGHQIAEMGATGTDKVMLHFEIRRAGKPINPTSLLTSSF